jgi:hypothetical protein
MNSQQALNLCNKVEKYYRSGITDMKTVANGQFNMIYWTKISLIIIIVCQLQLLSLADSPNQTISIEDLVSYTRIRNIYLSPNGEWVAYLAIRPQIATNRYHSTLFLQRTQSNTVPIELAQFYTTGDQTFDNDTGGLKKFGGQAIWSADSSTFVYTKRVSDKIQLRLRNLDKDVDVKIAGDFSNAEIVGWDEGNTTIEFKVSSESDNSKHLSEPLDPALNITESTNFWRAPWYSKPVLVTTFRSYKYNIISRELVEVENKRQSEQDSNQFIKYEDARWPTKPNETKYAHRPIVSPNKKMLVYLGQGFYNMKDIEKAYRDFFVVIQMMGESTSPKEFFHTPYYIHSFQWSRDSKKVYALVRYPEYTAIVAFAVDNGDISELIRTNHSLTNLCWNKDGTWFVAVRQSSLMPDELVKVDLIGKKVDVLAAPNASFAEKEAPEVRFMRINNPLGGSIFGQLVLPNRYVKGKLYPLIFTTYRAGTEFLEGASGNEFPILPFAANGFAVFAMDAGISNMLSASGDLEFTLMRLKRPLEAMELVRRQLSEEGIIDSERCAVTGLSYGSDIAAYAVANTKIFKAASVSISGLDPIMHQLNSVSRQKVLEEYGYPFPGGIGLEKWKQASIALNAANIVTPLLIQSPDSEAMFSLETYKALKHYGVPVDWYVYRGEGHVKNQPLNKYYVYRRNLDWMRFWLKDEVTENPDRQNQYSRWQMMKDAFRARQLSTGKEN